MPAVDDRFVFPRQACALDDETTLTPDQVDMWQTQGYTLVDGVFPAALVEELQAAAASHFPTHESAEAAAIRDFGSAVNFPSRLRGFNEMTLHPRLLGSVSQLLGCDVSGLRLSQSDLWPKYGRPSAHDQYDNQDQRIQRSGGPNVSGSAPCTSGGRGPCTEMTSSWNTYLHRPRWINGQCLVSPSRDQVIGATKPSRRCRPGTESSVSTQRPTASGGDLD